MANAHEENQIARVKLLTGETDDTLITRLVQDAQVWCLAYTGRAQVPDALFWNAVGSLAIVEYNRLGTQGESARSEGGESYTFETAPQSIISILNRYRLAKAGGKYHETVETE